MIHTKVSIIIPTHKRKDLLKNCLAKLAEIERDDFEIIIVNDYLSDDLSDVIGGNLMGKASIFNNQKNLGPACSRNLGAVHAQGEILAFIDDDILVSKNWIDVGVRAFSENDNRVAVVGKTVLPTGQFPHPFRHFMINDHPGRYPSCNLWIKKAAFEKAGGFSSDFFDKRWKIFHHEDADLCFRLMKIGTVVFNEELIAEHPAHSYSWHNPLKAAKKVFFDPLLFKRHPQKYDLLTRRCFQRFCLKRARTRPRIIDFWLFVLAVVLLFYSFWWLAGALVLLGIILLKVDVVRKIGWNNIFRIKIWEWPAILAVQFLALIYFNVFLVLGMFRAKKFFF
ncbi:MAG TPA: glycosyltransferase [Candidatus Paceibacterota bacterium]|nr:glycosyltransferase [Candidatus Paceibacterota bacterium]